MNENNKESTTGIKCPGCSYLIKTSVAELLQAGSLYCPSCSLRLMIDRNRSKEALTALNKVQAAHDKVQRTSKFNR